MAHNYNAQSWSDFAAAFTSGDHDTISFSGKGQDEAGLAVPAEVEKALSEFAPVCSHIKRITLSDLSVSRSFCMKLVGALLRAGFISELSVRKCGLTAKDAILLSQEIKSNTSLIAIDLKLNEIGDEGAVALAAAFRSHPKVSKIGLGRNGIGDSGARAIFNALESSLSIHVLDLWKNRITSDSWESVAKCLDVNRSLLVINLFNNRIPSAKIKLLKAILARNKANQARLLSKAMCSHQRVPWLHNKLMVIGRKKVGKTATIRSLLNKEFDPESASTDGIDICLVKSRAQAKISWEEQDQMDTTNSLVHRLALCLLESKFEAGGETVAFANPAKPRAAKPQGDGYKRSVSEAREKDSVQGENMPEASREVRYAAQTVFMNARDDRDSLNFHLFDLGGRDVYNVSHDLFLTSLGVYVYVLSLPDIEQDMHATVADFTFWAQSIAFHTNNPTMCLVATHADDLPNPLKTIDRFVKAVEPLLVRHSIHTVRHGASIPAFCIDNRSANGIQAFREALDETLRKQPHVQEKVSPQWSRALDCMRLQGKWIIRSKVVAICDDFGITDIEAMLDFFHAMGLIYYNRSNEVLRGVVTTDVSWIMEAFAAVIHDGERQSIAARAERVGLESDAQRLYRHGVVSRDLLEFLWDRTQVEFLINLLQQLMVASPWHTRMTVVNAKDTVDMEEDYGEVYEEQEEDFGEMYLISSMLPSCQEIHWPAQAWTFRLDFEFLPDGVFERMVCLVIMHCVQDTTSGKKNSEAKNISRLDRPILAKNIGRVALDASTSLWLRKEENGRVVASVSNKQRARWSMMLIVATIQQIQQGYTVSANCMLKYTLYVRNATRQMIPYDAAVRERVAPWFVQEENDRYGETDLDSFMGL